MKHQLKAVLAIASCVTVSGCAATIDNAAPLSPDATKSSGTSTSPYHLPSHYMLVTRNLPITTAIAAGANGTPGAPTLAGGNQRPARPQKSVISTNSYGSSAESTKDYYDFRIISLPETGKQYGLAMPQGSGSASSSLVFAGGWKYNGFNVSNEAKTTDFFTAIGSVVTKFIPDSIIIIDKSDRGNKGLRLPAIWLYIINSNGSFSPKAIFEWQAE